MDIPFEKLTHNLLKLIYDSENIIDENLNRIIEFGTNLKRRVVKLEFQYNYLFEAEINKVRSIPRANAIALYFFYREDILLKRSGTKLSAIENHLKEIDIPLNAKTIENRLTRCNTNRKDSILKKNYLEEALTLLKPYPKAFHKALNDFHSDDIPD